MLNRIEIKSIISSFWVGVIIGGAFNFFSGESNLVNLLITLVVSGGIGILIALCTELITLIIPISIAKPRTYFMISSVIGMSITLIMIYFMNVTMMCKDPIDKLTIVGIVIILISSINLIDYHRYKKTNERLKVYQGEHF